MKETTAKKPTKKKPAKRASRKLREGEEMQLDRFALDLYFSLLEEGFKATHIVQIVGYMMSIALKEVKCMPRYSITTDETL